MHRILKLPEQVLGAEESKRIASIDPDKWYPVEWLLELMERVEELVGHYGLLRLGRTIFDLSAKEHVVAVAHSARDILYGMDGFYRHVNRGTSIGGWKVLKFEPGYAELEKTTPHHCVMEQGILAAALTAVRCPGTVAQSQCFRKGDPSCIFTVTSSIADARWFGVMPAGGVV